jgi:hypothetical protein
MSRCYRFQVKRGGFDCSPWFRVSSGALHDSSIHHLVSSPPPPNASILSYSSCTICIYKTSYDILLVPLVTATDAQVQRRRQLFASNTRKEADRGENDQEKEDRGEYQENSLAIETMSESVSFLYSKQSNTHKT